MDHATINRQKKSLDMVAAIDRAALRQNPPVDPFDQAGKILLAMKSWSDDVWHTVAKNAGYTSKKTPGPTTREMVRAVYTGRATAPVQHRRAS